jgi:RNA polymerase sigma-70 factor (ECF subfamily)
MEAWIEAARRGSGEALGRLLEECRRYLQWLANQQVPAAIQAKGGASDLVQETFLEAQRDFVHFQGQTEEELRAWLRRILLHNCANFKHQFLRTEKRQVQREVPLAGVTPEELRRAKGTPQPSPSAEARVRERDETLNRALDQLSEPYRQAICWRSYERCSFQEIGRRLGRSAEAARKLWIRAIHQLQHVLEAADESR